MPLAAAIAESWQYAVLAGAAIALLPLRRAIVPTLLLGGAAGILSALLGGPIPG